MGQQKDQPALHSERLLLRPLTLDDAPKIQIMVSDKRVSEMTANIPHPYPDEAAVAWINTHGANWQQRKQVSYGISLTSTQEIIGAMGLVLRDPAEVELGYWLGVDYWGFGYATEAAKRIISFGFNELGLNFVKARVLSRNPASGRVLLKSGFTHSRTEAGSCGSKFESLDYYECLAEPMP